MQESFLWKELQIMPKITFMGAGSTVFARNVLGDCMCTPSLCESEIALYDIDAERLEESYIILSAINKNTNGGKATLKTSCAKPRDRSSTSIPTVKYCQTILS